MINPLGQLGNLNRFPPLCKKAKSTVPFVPSMEDVSATQKYQGELSPLAVPIILRRTLHVGKK